MRILVVLILLAFGLQGQQTTVNGQQTLCTVPEPVEGTTLGASTSSATAYTRTVDCCPLSVDYYENQIRKADSLYKNYLPQSNFEEVKAAMEFFDSRRLSKTTDNGQQTTDIFHRIFPNKRQRTICTVPEPVEGTISGASTSSATAYTRTVDCCLLSVDFICAKAHYYHAVGLTEKDDIVGACEHYLTALEIMEPLVETSPLWRLMANDKRQKTKEKTLCDSVTLRLCDSEEDYEKIRFVHLIHTRLGELFLEEGCSNLSIINNISALRYSYMLNNVVIQARTLKCIGNGYLLSNNIDSALFYYNESLKICSDNDNKLDIEKCFAQILYNEGEKNTAFALLKKNLNEINNENVKYSYHCLLGNLYYNNKVYDSALYYLEESLDNNIITKKIAFTTTLSAIYDSISNYEKKAYYDNFSANLLKNSINKEVDRTKLQILYNNYNQRKADKEITTAKMKARNKTITISIIVLVVVTFVIIYIRYNHKKQNDKLKKEIDGYAIDIDNKDIIISQKEQLVGEYKKAIEKKDEIIKKQSNEIQNYIYEKEQVTTMDFESYYNCNICKKILNEKEERYTALSAADLSLLVDSANENLNNILKKLKELYPQLNNNDMYYICLSMLNISVNGTSYLMGRTRKTVWLRIKTIKSYMNLKDNDDLLTFLKTIR